MKLAPLKLLMFALASLACLTPAVSVAAESEASAPHPLFLKVTGPKGVAYLFGTIHVGKASFYPLPQIIEDSFKRADMLVEEINLSDPGETERAKKMAFEQGLYSGSDSAANHLSEVTRAHLIAYINKSGQSEAVVARMKPWLIGMVIGGSENERRGLDPALGLDRHFLDEARQQHKRVEGLETAESQIKLFSSLSPDLVDQYLLTSLVEAEKDEGELDRTVEAWRAGDADKLEALTTSSVAKYPELEPIAKRLLDDRNDAMAQRIEQYLQTSKMFFVAVGAAHLVGKHSIPALLRSRKFSVEQL